MITTGSIKINLNADQVKLKRITTKNVDASVKVEHATQKPVGLSTRNLADVADIVEKKRRDDIMAERVKVGGYTLEVLNRRFVFLDIADDGLVQGFPRRELT